MAQRVEDARLLEAAEDARAASPPLDIDFDSMPIEEVIRLAERARASIEKRRRIREKYQP
jgi:hypothetical protein